MTAVTQIERLAAELQPRPGERFRRSAASTGDEPQAEVFWGTSSGANAADGLTHNDPRA